MEPAVATSQGAGAHRGHAWVPFELPRLGGRADPHAACGHGGGACARGQEQGRGRLRTQRSLREPTTACWRRAGARREWWSRRAPTRRSSPPSSCASRRSTAPPPTPGIGPAPPTGRVAEPRRRWRPGWCRWRTPPTPAGRSGYRPDAAASSASSRRAASSRSGRSSARWWAGSTATTRSPGPCATPPPCSTPRRGRRSARRYRTQGPAAPSSRRSTSPPARFESSVYGIYAAMQRIAATRRESKT